VSGSPAPVSDRAKLSIRGLGMAFRADSGEIRVLEDIDLDVREGEFVCILGPSGCGKSTLLNVVAGFLDPTAGAVLIDGQEVRGPDPRRIFVFQERGVFPWLTAAGNIGFGLGRLPRAERERRVRITWPSWALPGSRTPIRTSCPGG
jgi:NitT/TauT family transport system ATP-binding protein